MKYRCRTIVPKECDWVEIEADRPEDAANHFLFKNAGHSTCYIPAIKHIIRTTDGERGETVYFARIEVEGHDSWIVRCFSSGIYRGGGVSRREPPPTLAELAEILGFKQPPEELIGTGWDGEESY